MTKRNQKHIQAILDLASVADQVEGLNWYQNANTATYRLIDQYEEINFYQAAGVIAALSPRNWWHRNLIDAENLIAAFLGGGLEAASKVKCCTFNANKKKAIEILNLPLGSNGIDEILEVLKGPKVSEFFACILGQDDICIDGHAYAIWFGDRVTVSKTPKIGVKLRQQIKADYQAVAKKNNLNGFQVQAITWLSYRRLHGITK